MDVLIVGLQVRVCTLHVCYVYSVRVHQTWGQLHLNVINYYYYYTIACPITITIILHIKITLLYYYYYYNAINYYYYYSVIFQLIFENINASLKYNYCIRFPMTVSVKRRPSGQNMFPATLNHLTGLEDAGTDKHRLANLLIAGGHITCD